MAWEKGAVCLAFISLLANAVFAGHTDSAITEAETLWDEAQIQLRDAFVSEGLSADTESTSALQSAIILLRRAINVEPNNPKYRLGIARVELALMQQSSEAQIEATRELEQAFMRTFGIEDDTYTHAHDGKAAENAVPQLDVKSLVDGLPDSLRGVFARDKKSKPANTDRASASASDAFGFPPSEYPLSPQWSTLNQTRWMILHCMCEGYSRKQLYNTYGLFSSLKLLNHFSLSLQPPLPLHVLEQGQVVSHFGFVSTAVGSYFDMIWSRIHTKIAKEGQRPKETQKQTHDDRERMELTWENSLLALTSALDRNVIQLSTMGFNSNNCTPSFLSLVCLFVLSQCFTLCSDDIQAALRFSCGLKQEQIPAHGQWNYSKTAWGSVVRFACCHQ